MRSSSLWCAPPLPLVLLSLPPLLPPPLLPSSMLPTARLPLCLCRPAGCLAFGSGCPRRSRPGHLCSWRPRGSDAIGWWGNPCRQAEDFGESGPGTSAWGRGLAALVARGRGQGEKYKHQGGAVSCAFLEEVECFLLYSFFFFFTSKLVLGNFAFLLYFP